MLSYFTEVAEAGYSQLFFQLRIAWLTPQAIAATYTRFVHQQRKTHIDRMRCVGSVGD